MSDDDRVRWNKRWQAVSPSRPSTEAWFPNAADLLPTNGRAIDVAGGLSGDGLALARHGLTTTVADISDVALAALRQHAAIAGLPAGRLTTAELDLDVDPFPAGPWDVIGVANYLNRALFAPMLDALAPGGLFVAVVATTTNLERHERPSERFLVKPGELLQLAARPGFEVVRADEKWRDNGRHEAWLLVRAVIGV